MTLAGGMLTARRNITLGRPERDDSEACILGCVARAEAAISESLRRLQAGRAVFLIIRRRLGAPRRPDPRPAPGKVVETGFHDDLTAEGVRYRELYDLPAIACRDSPDSMLSSYRVGPALRPRARRSFGATLPGGRRRLLDALDPNEPSRVAPPRRGGRPSSVRTTRS